jgi:predicted Zn-dependent protease
MSRSAVLAITAVVGSAGLISCDTPTEAPAAFAYDPTTLTAGKLYRWENGRRLDVWVVPTADASRDLTRATSEAVARWNTVPRGDRFTLRMATSAAEAEIIVFERGSPLPVALPASCPYGSTGAVGYTYFCGEGPRALPLPLTGTTTGSARVLVRIDFGRLATQGELAAIVMHELGHAVGIGGHSLDTLDVMHANPRRVTPSGRDTQTLRWLLAQRADLLL